MVRKQVIGHAPGRTFDGDPLGYSTEGISILVSLLGETKGVGAGAPEN